MSRSELSPTVRPPRAVAAAEPRALEVLEQRYRILERMAASCDAEVYRGEALDRPQAIAIKILRSANGFEAEALARFRLEAEIVCRIAHPHVAHVYEGGVLPDGRPFVVTELLDGQSLAHLVKRKGRLAVGDAVRLVSQVGAALAAMHWQGVVHGDVRAKKVFRTTGSVKVLDAGLRALRAAPPCTSEQPPEPRQDVFGLACLAYELLTGRYPFASKPDVAARVKLLADLVPPSKACAGLADGVDPVILLILEGRPQECHASASRFVAALASAAAGSTTRQRRARTEPRAAKPAAPEAATTPPGAAKPPEPPAASLPRGATALMSAARSAFLDGHLDEAVEAAEKLWEAAALAQDVEARRVVATSMPLLERIFSERLGSLERRVGRGAARDLNESKLTAKAREIVSLADGRTSVGRLIAATGAPPRDAVRMIAGLVRRRVLVIL